MATQTTISLIIGDENELIISQTNDILKSSQSHIVIICEKTGRIANSMASMYKGFDDVMTTLSLAEFRSLCEHDSFRHRITVINIDDSNNWQDQLTTNL